MKKNLISIVILALLIVNIALSAITLISVAGTNKKTAALVTDVAAAISLDLGTESEEAASSESISMADVVTYDIADMTIPMKTGEDGASHFGVITVTISMNSLHEDYETYGDLSTRESLIKGEINDVVSSYTMEEARDNRHQLEEDILARVQALFNSDFIYAVTLSSAIYQ